MLTGFINAVAINIILGQLDYVTGYEADGENRVARAVDTALNVPGWQGAAVVASAATIALILVLERTRLGALVVPALSLAFVGLVQGAAISSSVPT